MSSVTRRIRDYRQPWGGFIRPKLFSVIQAEDDIVLNPENIEAYIVGTAVDYLTRLVTGGDKDEAFQIPIRGAMVVKEFNNCCDLLEKVKGIDDDSILAACQLVGYDTAYRAGPEYHKPVSEIQPDQLTIDNIRTMVNRSISFWQQYGPVVKNGFGFEGGYTKIINSGDGDYLTADTLWDFKVLKGSPNSNHTLQLLVYYIMGMHSKHPEFKNIKRLGIFNPRLNRVYLLDIDSISSEIFEEVSTKVIGY